MVAVSTIELLRLNRPRTDGPAGSSIADLKGCARTNRGGAQIGIGPCQGQRAGTILRQGSRACDGSGHGLIAGRVEDQRAIVGNRPRTNSPAGGPVADLQGRARADRVGAQIFQSIAARLVVWLIVRFGFAGAPPWLIAAAPARTTPPVGKAVGATVWLTACAMAALENKTIENCENAAASNTVRLISMRSDDPDAMA